MQTLLNSSRIYLERRVFGVLLLGFSSGLPFLLTLGTLQAWLERVGISKTTIGLFALATAPYALKFLWAPLTDHLPIPYLSSKLGLKRSWLLLSQLTLALALMGLGTTDPAQNIAHTAFATFLVCLCASFQDNAMEAYRIETLNEKEMGPGAGASVLGFRIGMLVSGGGALYLAAYCPWKVVYALMATCVSIGMVATLLIPNSDRERTIACQRKKPHQAMWPAITSFLQNQDWKIILLFILCYKVGDTGLNMMSIPFLLEMGFSKLEIASIAKTFGFFAMVAGGFIGGLLLLHLSLLKNLALGISLLMTSSVMFMIQAVLGHDTTFLMLTMGVENLACGMSAAALIAYLSKCCHVPYTATHYALFSSFSSVVRIGLSVGAGWLADQVSWMTFYGIIAVGCLPALMLLSRFSLHFYEPKRSSLAYEQKIVQTS
ncbi:MAG: MFS transporter [Pseudomonadota bacterium]